MDWARYKGPLILMGLVIIFIIITLVMGEGDLIQGDKQMFMALNPPFNPSNPTIFDHFFIAFSHWGPVDWGLATWGFIALGLVLFCLSFKYSKLRSMRFLTILVLVGILVGFLGITIGLKHVILRQRPFMDLALSSSALDWVPHFYSTTPALMFDLGLESFPSGHATVGFIFATAFILIYKSYWIRIPAITYGILAAYARVYLGVHYPLDILVGSIIGILTTWLFYKIFRRYLLQKVAWFKYIEADELIEESEIEEFEEEED